MTRLPSSRPATKITESSSTGTSGRAIAAVVAGVLGSTMPLPAMAGPADIDTNYQDGSRESARALTGQGQASFDAGDYTGAADAWKKILDILPENDLNREERENALLISLEAYKHAFRRASVEKGSVSPEDIELLRAGLALCDAYTKEVSRVHGPASVSPAVVESRVELEGMLAGNAPTETRTPVIIPTNNNNTMLERNVVQRGPSGNGLIAAGSASIVVGLAMMPLVIIGASRAKEADEQIEAAMGDMNMQAEAEAQDQKKAANAMIISGSVLMGVLTIGGATMLGIGIRRRIRYTAFTPTVGPRYVGFSLQHRF